jgi:hypothetical protein
VALCPLPLLLAPLTVDLSWELLVLQRPLLLPWLLLLLWGHCYRPVV